MLPITLLSLLGGAAAFPSILKSLQEGRNLNADDFLRDLSARDVSQPGCTTSDMCEKSGAMYVSDEDAHIPTTPNAATDLSAARTNCGIEGVCTDFNAEEQYVSTSGDHAYIPPGPNDIRGPCPGLNAAANHNYLPRSGVATIETTTLGLFNAYGMAQDFGAFLAVFSIILGGDLETLSWSIGGPQSSPLLGPVLGTAQGISYTHNFYEGDTSISRCDAYTNGGDAHSSSVARFATAWASKNEDGLYTMDTMSRLYAKNTVRSVMTNPYYFAPLVSTTVVSPAAYNFVIAFMSNHSADAPGGYLNPQIFQEFFAMSGEYPNFVWNRGQERIPENWYRRPNMNPYGASSLAADLVPEFLAYPDSFRFGGNVNGTNTYTGIDIADFTNGAYNADTILQGDNLGCLFFQFTQQAVPTQAQGGLEAIAQATALFTKYIPEFFSSLTCPELGQFDSGVFQPYTGKGSPTAPPADGMAYC